jgi:anti-sigma regulatory factor (Ser/Thr protein kinase)
MYCNWVLAYVDTGTNDSPIVIYTSIDTEGYHWSVGDSGLHLEKVIVQFGYMYMSFIICL